MQSRTFKPFIAPTDNGRTAELVAQFEYSALPTWLVISTPVPTHKMVLREEHFAEAHMKYGPNNHRACYNKSYILLHSSMATLQPPSMTVLRRACPGAR